MRNVLVGCLLIVGCSHGPGGPADGGSVDAAAADLSSGPADSAIPVDLAATVDLSVGSDLAVVSDFSVVPDLTVVPDLATASAAAFPLFDGLVTAIVHSGNSLYVGGRFTRVSRHAAPQLVALDASGNPVGCPLGTGFDGVVEAVIQSGNAIYVGGLFTHYQGASAKGIAKIDTATCALDSSFSPPAANGFDGWVNALAISGSSLYVGGDFSAYRGVANSANNLAKLDLVSGTLDTSFSPAGATSNGFNGHNAGGVAALAVSGSSLYVGGGFTAYKGVAGSANHLAKLDLTSGALDGTFTPAGVNGFDDFVAALAVSPTSIYVGGFFTSYKGVANSAQGLAKLDLASGVLDTTFSPVGAANNGFNAGGRVHALAVSATSIYVGGEFSRYRGASPANGLAKLDLASGAIDTTFSPSDANANGFLGPVWALALTGDSLYAAGQFTAYRGVQKSANNLAKLDASSGALDATFLPADGKMNGVSDAVRALHVAGSTLWVGGYFRIYGGYPANHLVKLDDTTFAIDTDFSPPDANGFDSWVNALVVSGASLYVGGTFSGYKGVANSASRVAKLDLASGAIDTTFSPPGANSNGFDAVYPDFPSVRALTVAGNALYVGGTFSKYRGTLNAANSLAKLDLASGAIDITFSPPGATANGFEGGAQVTSLAASADALYVGGHFTAYKGVANSANYLAKLNLTSGAIDTTFSPPGAASNGFDTSNSDEEVSALLVAGGSLYVGGQFKTYRGVANSANSIAKLNLASGALDTTFSPPGAANNGFDPNGPYTDVLALASDGTSLYVGGWELSAYRGVPLSANSIAKLELGSGAIDTTFSPPGLTSNGFGVSDSVWALAVAGDSICVGGHLEAYRGTSALGNLTRLELSTGVLK